MGFPNPSNQFMFLVDMQGVLQHLPKGKWKNSFLLKFTLLLVTRTESSKSKSTYHVLNDLFCMMCCVSQLRNLVWATTKHDVYTMHDQSVTHWSSLEQTSTELINADDCIVPKQVYNLLYFFGIQYFCAASYSFWFGLKYPFLLLHRGGMVHSQWQWSRSQQWPWIVIYWQLVAFKGSLYARYSYCANILLLCFQSSNSCSKSDILFLVFTSAWMMMGLFTAQGLQMMKMQSLTLQRSIRIPGKIRCFSESVILFIWT